VTEDDSVNREFRRRFGRRLKVLRVERGLSQEQLGQAAGMHRTFIGLLERGERGVNVDRLPDLARALGVEEHELIPRRPAADHPAEEPPDRSPPG
jgi:transcriptional regulator with XRE-family HTH domain